MGRLPTTECTYLPTYLDTQKKNIPTAYGPYPAFFLNGHPA